MRSISVGIFKNIPYTLLTFLVIVRFESANIFFSRKVPQSEVTGLLFPAPAQTGSETSPVSYPVGNGGYFLGNKATEA
jgi:hypothetical protein